MSYSILRLERVKNATATNGFQRHNQRENQNYSNKDINHELSDKNYDLINGTDRINYNEKIENRIEEGYTGKRAVRKDAIKHVQGIITSDTAFFENKKDEDTRKFFEDGLKFVQERYGKDNVLYATVHHDEKTPHMHFGFVPLTADGRLSAKDQLGNKRDLSALQDEFSRYVNEKGYNMERGTSAKDTGTRHLSVEEFKKKQERKNELTVENERLECMTEQFERTIDRQKREVAENNEKAKKNQHDLEKTEKEIELKHRQLSDYQEMLKQETERKREVKKEKKLGRETGNVVISAEDYQSLSNQALYGEQAKENYDDLFNRARNTHLKNIDLEKKIETEQARRESTETELRYEQAKTGKLESEIKEYKQERQLLAKGYLYLKKNFEGFEDGFNQVAAHFESHNSLQNVAKVMKNIQKTAQTIEIYRQRDRGIEL